MIKGLQVFNVQMLMEKVKNILQKRYQENLDQDENFGDNLDIDNTNIDFLYNMSFFFKTIRLIMIIINFSYFFGMMWLTYAQVINYYELN